MSSPPQAGAGGSGPLLAAYLALAAACLYVGPDGAWRDPVSDAVEYAVGAQRLVTTGRYEVVLNGEAHPPRYPPAFSALFVAPVYALGGGELGSGVLPVFLSALAVLALVWRSCRRTLDGAAAVSAAFVALALLLQTTFFYARSRQIMSDVPTLMLGWVALALFERGRRRPTPALFAVAGAVAGLAASLRMTGLALALPFAFLLARTPRSALRPALALAAPLVAAAAANLLYNQAVFGGPLHTGYHYWFGRPGPVALTTRSVGPNLYEFANPFLPFPWQRTAGQGLVGPAAGACIAALGLAVRRRRPAVWRCTRGVLAFLALASLPILVFHLFFPFPSARFVLLFHTLALLLGAVWAAAFLDRVPRAGHALLVLAAVATCLATRPPRPDGEGFPRLALLRAADRLLPDAAWLASRANGMYVEATLLAGTKRRYLPLDRRAPFVGWRNVGPVGGPKGRVFAFHAAGAPERVAALLEAGERVFADVPARRDPALEALLSRFARDELFVGERGETLVELRLPPRAGPAPAALTPPGRAATTRADPPRGPRGP